MLFTRGAVIVLAAAAALPACSSEELGVGEVLVTSVVDIDPPGAGIGIGTTQQLTATPKTASGIPIPNREVVWFTSNRLVATVSNTGLVKAVSLGRADITAEVDQVSATVPVTVTPTPVAEAARVRFTDQPSNGIVGQPLSTIKVAVQDVIGGTVANATNPVTIALANNPGNATLSGTRTVNAVNGVATFSDLQINRAGSGYTLRATSGELSPATSSAFAVVSQNPSSLAITTQPSPTAVSGQRLQQQPVVQLRDSGGNDVAKAGIEIEASLQGSGGKLGGTLKVSSDASGSARFTDLRITGSGNYRLRFRASGLGSVESGTIKVTADDD